MTVISNNHIAHAIYEVAKNKTHTEQSLVFPQIVQFLFRKRLLSKSLDILERLNKVINDREGRIVAKISSAGTIDETKKKELIHILTKRYPGKEIILVSSLDEKLLGGFKIEVNDEVIDLSIKNRMKQLQEYLTSNHE